MATIPVPTRTAMPSLRERVRRAAPRPSATRILQPSGEAILEWIGVNDLLVDKYQRIIRSPRVNKIIREFNSDTFGIITVALRDNGDLFVVDGQHRVAAIRRMQDEGDNQQVLCVVISGWTPEDEAKFFAESQRNRGTITPAEAHNAEVFASDETAAEIDRAVKRCGFHIDAKDDRPGSGRIRAIGALYRITNTFGIEVLENALYIAAVTWGSDEVPLEPTINGLASFNLMYPKSDYKRVVAKLRELDQDDLIGKGKGIADLMGYRLHEGIAQEIFNRYNVKMTKNRLDDFAGRREALRRYMKKRGVAPRTPRVQP